MYVMDFIRLDITQVVGVLIWAMVNTRHEQRTTTDLWSLGNCEVSMNIPFSIIMMF